MSQTHSIFIYFPQPPLPGNGEAAGRYAFSFHNDLVMGVSVFVRHVEFRSSYCGCIIQSEATWLAKNQRDFFTRSVSFPRQFTLLLD
jgi:hypothetical protein